MNEWFELYKLIYEVPNLLIRGVEDVRSVFVDKDVVLILAVAVTAHVATTVDDQHSLTRLMGAICRNSTVQSGADNEKVIFECRIQN